MPESEQCEETSIVVQNETTLPLIDIDSAVAEWENYQELTEKLLDESDYQGSGDDRFKKKSAWRKYGKAFNVSTKILEEKLVYNDEGRIVTAKYIVEAKVPSGRSEQGIGLCSIWDKAHEHNKQFGQRTCTGPCDGRKHYDKPEHDIPSTAHTRAKNRAISDLIGAGEVSAEEIDFTQNSSKKKGKKNLANIPSPEDDAKLANDLVNQEMNKKDKPPAPPEKTPKSVDKSTVQDAEITEKKGKSPGGKSQEAISEDMSNTASKVKVHDMVPFNERLTKISKELGQWYDSFDAGKEPSEEEIIKKSMDILGTGGISKDKHTEVKRACGIVN